MASRYNLPRFDVESVFTSEDRIDHLTKYFERQFGEPASSLGQVVAKGTGAVLRTDVEGIVHEIAFARQSNGQLFWFLDTQEEPIALLPGSRAIKMLRTIVALP